MIGEIVGAMFGGESSQVIEIPANPELIKQLAGIK